MSGGASTSVNRGNSSGASAAEEAARRAAEAARKAAAEAARKAAEAARKAAESQRKPAGQPKEFKTAFEDGQNPRKFEKLLGLTPPARGPQGTEASTLLTEDAKDGNVNCLDVAADWVNKASPELRSQSEMVFLEDTRSGAEGETGHVVVRQGDRVLDPSTNKSYENMEAFQAARPENQPDAPTGNGGN